LHVWLGCCLLLFLEWQQHLMMICFRLGLRLLMVLCLLLGQHRSWLQLFHLLLLLLLQ
jgi:hypothetical protein